MKVKKIPVSSLEQKMDQLNSSELYAGNKNGWCETTGYDLDMLVNAGHEKNWMIDIGGAFIPLPKSQSREIITELAQQLENDGATVTVYRYGKNLYIAGIMEPYNSPLYHEDDLGDIVEY